MKAHHEDCLPPADTRNQPFAFMRQGTWATVHPLPPPGSSQALAKRLYKLHALTHRYTRMHARTPGPLKGSDPATFLVGAKTADLRPLPHPLVSPPALYNK